MQKTCYFELTRNVTQVLNNRRPEVFNTGRRATSRLTNRNLFCLIKLINYILSRLTWMRKVKRYFFFFFAFLSVQWVYLNCLFYFIISVDEDLLNKQKRPKVIISPRTKNFEEVKKPTQLWTQNVDRLLEETGKIFFIFRKLNFFCF